ncbi:MAG: hypothetical protein KatS3mg077_2792 [Candidatus Binatia bacterium]|nr:MAG: hypothetical protein KatS3mg077_2792 [Candidatus Binatia bacterium]
MVSKAIAQRRVLLTHKLLRSSRPRAMALSDAREKRLLVQLIIVWATLFAVVCAAHTAIRLRVLDLAYRIEATHGAIARLELQSRELRARAVRLEDPQRLEALAKERLGLSRPSPGQRLVLP